MKKLSVTLGLALVSLVAHANGVERVLPVGCMVNPNGINNGSFIVSSQYPESDSGYSYNHNFDATNNQGKKVTMAAWGQFSGPSSSPTQFILGISHWDGSSPTVDQVSNKVVDLRQSGGLVKVSLSATTVDGIQVNLLCQSIKK